MTKKETNGADKTDRYRAPALDKGLDILELLASQPGGLTRAEIVTHMGRNPSEFYRMLERLVARDYVRRSVGGDRYSLSLKLFQLGSSHPPIRLLVSHAQPLMDQFAGKAMQSVHLVIPEMGKAVVVAQASGPANWVFRLRIGATLDLASTGSGITLLAFQDEHSLAEIVAKPEQAKLDSQKLIDKKLTKEIATIKDQGFRINDSGQLVGVTDISVPLKGTNGNAFGVLTCPYIKRIDEHAKTTEQISVEQTKTLLMELATQMSVHQQG